MTHFVLAVNVKMLEGLSNIGGANNRVVKDTGAQAFSELPPTVIVACPFRLLSHSSLFPLALIFILQMTATLSLS